MRTICKRGHAMTPENTYTVPTTGADQCRACRRVSTARHGVRRRAGESVDMSPGARFDRKWTEAPDPHPILGTKCWLWTAGMARGYGSFGLGGGMTQAHRFSYEHHIGPIPEGLQIDHLCRVRNCVNPSHMEPVTARVNCLRGESPAAQHATRTHCPKGHLYSGDNLYIIPSTGGRVCQECRKFRHERELDRRRAMTTEQREDFNAHARRRYAARVDLRTPRKEQA